jgi:hypothetical protein
MITVFCDFCKFLPIFGEKIGVFLKYQCYDQLFSKFSYVLSQKRHFFAKFFGENIIKIITSVPGHPAVNRHGVREGQVQNQTAKKASSENGRNKR